MRHLAPAEAQTGLHLVAVGEEVVHLVFLCLIVVFVDGDGELDFLDGDDFLLFARGALALFFFVEVAAVVLDTADRGDGIGRDFDQVEAALAGDLQGFVGREDSQLYAVFVDDADFARANPLVDPDEGLGRTFIECDMLLRKLCRPDGGGLSLDCGLTKRKSSIAGPAAVKSMCDEVLETISCSSLFATF